MDYSTRARNANALNLDQENFCRSNGTSSFSEPLLVVSPVGAVVGIEESLGEVPVVERHVRGDVISHQLVDQVLVKLHALEKTKRPE